MAAVSRKGKGTVKKKGKAVIPPDLAINQWNAGSLGNKGEESVKRKIKKQIGRLSAGMIFMLAVLLSLPVHSEAAKASITLNTKNLMLEAGKSATLKPTVTGRKKKVTWKSSKSTVAAVNKNGKVTAKKKGTAVITATANGKKAKCVVKVSNPNYKILYKRFLEKGIAKFKPEKGPARKDSIGYYGVADINQDKIPELVVSRYAMGDRSVYTVKTGKVSYAGSYVDVRGAAEVMVSRKYKALYHVANMSGATHTNWSKELFRLSFGKLKSYKYSYCSEFYFPHKSQEYKTGSSLKKAKKTSKSSLKSFEKKYFTGITSSPIVENTSANRAVSFG